MSDDPFVGTAHGMKWNHNEWHSESNADVIELYTTKDIAPGNYLHFVISIHQSSLSISQTQVTKGSTILCTISSA
jgi:hypothetical protein